MTGAVIPVATLTSGWFALLSMFVAFNTLVYAGLALSKLWPRRRR